MCLHQGNWGGKALFRRSGGCRCDWMRTACQSRRIAASRLPAAGCAANRGNPPNLPDWQENLAQSGGRTGAFHPGFCRNWQPAHFLIIREGDLVRSNHTPPTGNPAIGGFFCRFGRPPAGGGSPPCLYAIRGGSPELDRAVIHTAHRSSSATASRRTDQAVNSAACSQFHGC